MIDSTPELRPANHDGNARGGVQSIERAFDLLEMLADAGGALGLSELAANSGLPLPTVHRLMRTLVNRGYVRQEASRRYALGSRLIRLGETSSRMLGTWLRPFLAQLVRETGETANLAMLDGDEVVYIAQVPSPHSMRMFTEPGRRVSPHCTAVGKALLAQVPADQARALLERGGMPPRSSSARACSAGTSASRALPTAVQWGRTRRPGSVNIRIECGLGTWAM